MRRVVKAFWIALAAVFLFEAWLWDHLRPIVGWLVGLIPWRALKERIATAVEHLPPYPTLAVFLIPVIVLFPIKVLGLWMLAHGHWLGAMGTLVLAKVVGMAVAAFVFDITRPKLLQLPWFRVAYEWVMAALAWAHRLLDPIKAELRAWFARQLVPVRKHLRRAAWLLKPQRAGRFARRLWRIRARMQARARAA